MNRYWGALLLSLTIISCKKDNELLAPSPGDGDTTVVTSNFYKVIRVENFAADTANVDADPTGNKATVYFSLEQNKKVDEKYAKTSQWDMAFGSLYNSYISGNNGTATGNYGYGNRATGGVAILANYFDDVTELPADLVFKGGRDVYGGDAGGNFGDGIGWYLYDFGGTLVRDGAYDNQHVAYALGNPLTLVSGQVMPARTLIVKTANGNIAKVKMISVYKNVYTPALWFRTTPHMYFTFEYVMIPAGETRFLIK